MNTSRREIDDIAFPPTHTNVAQTIPVHMAYGLQLVWDGEDGLWVLHTTTTTENMNLGTLAKYAISCASTLFNIYIVV